MADLLEGNTGHTNYAPLSHGQSMAVSRYLQDQIRALQQSLADLGTGLQETNGAVAELRKNQGGAQQALTSLQDSLANISSAVESQRGELGRTNANVGKLQQGHDDNKDKIGALSDAWKVDHHHILKLDQELKDHADKAHQLSETMKKKIQEDINGLRDELSRTLLDIKHMRADQDALKAGVEGDRENLRLTNLKVKDHGDRMNAWDTYLKILEQRVADNTAGLKAKGKDLEDLNLATLKLHEDHENTKANLGEVGNNIKKVNNHVKTVHSKLEATAQGLQGVAGKLDQQGQDAEDLRLKLQDVGSKVQSLGEGQHRNGDTLANIMRELAEVGATAERVRAGLKEQSSLLLPNITLDSAEARMASARHGSLLATNTMIGMGTSPKKTPRRPPMSASGNLAWT